jgi:hypothetical protein
MAIAKSMESFAEALDGSLCDAAHVIPGVGVYLEE